MKLFFPDRQTIISPVILCGPGQPGILKKAVILSFQHCANMRQGGWMLSLCASDTPPDEPPRWHVSFFNFFYFHLIFLVIVMHIPGMCVYILPWRH